MLVEFQFKNPHTRRLAAHLGDEHHDRLPQFVGVGRERRVRRVQLVDAPPRLVAGGVARVVVVTQQGVLLALVPDGDLLEARAPRLHLGVEQGDALGERCLAGARPGGEGGQL